MELMLLVVNSIRTGGKKITKALFKKKNPPVQSMLEMSSFFKKWLCLALKIIQERHADEEIRDQPKVEELLVIAGMNLISGIHVIKYSKQVSILK